MYDVDALKSPKVMIIDDHMPTRLIGRKFLEREGFIVDELADGQQVMQRIDDFSPDLIMLDVMLPDVDGFTLCQQFKSFRATENIPIIMMTGLDDHESIAKAYQMGATDFVTKPVNWTIMGHRLRYILRASHAIQDIVYSNAMLERSQQRLANAHRIARIGHWEQNLDTGECYWSEQLRTLLQLNRRSLVPSLPALLNFVYPEDRECLKSTLNAIINSGEPGKVEHRLKTAKDQTRFVIQQIELTEHPSTKAKFISAIVQDVTAEKQAKDKMHDLANNDYLTGLPNRRYFKEIATEFMRAAKRHQQFLAVLFLDLDNFKRINDTLGHGVGDLLLKAAALKLQTVLRRYDYVTADATDPRHIVARFGGDEFTIILPNIKNKDDVNQIAQRITQIFSEPLDIVGRKLYVSTSIGISLFPDDGNDIDSLLKHADIAMYQAKASGRNRYYCYHSSLNTKAFERLAVENQLRQAIDDQQLRVFFQPKLNLKSREFSGAEVLLRWQHPKAGLLSPNQFIHVAEETGLIIPIGRWMFQAVCQQIRAWLNINYSPFPVAINLSALQFKQINLAAEIVEQLQHAELPANLFEFEITENIIMQDSEHTIKTLTDLKQIGVRLAVDDFGTGYSSLAYLKRFPIDRIKIDRSFVVDFCHNNDDLAIIKAIIGMAKALNLQVTAEGVETQGQFEQLTDLNCDEIQGFLFAKPMSAENFIDFLKRYHTFGPELGSANSPIYDPTSKTPLPIIKHH